jgi:hypothetical protein
LAGSGSGQTGLRAERCPGIGEVADNRCGQFVRDADRQGAGQFVARSKTEGHGAPARQNHTGRRLRDLAQPLQVFLGGQLGGDRKNVDLVVADQHRLSAAQRSDRLAEGWLCRRFGLEHSLSPCRPASYGATRLAPATLFDLTYAAEWTAE